MVPSGRWPRPSASTGSRWDGQFTHASFTRLPLASTTHRDAVDSVGAVAAAAWWHAASTARTTGTSHADAAGGDGGENLMATATAMVVWKRKGERWPRIYRQAAGGEGGRRLLQGIVTDSPRRLLSC